MQLLLVRHSYSSLYGTFLGNGAKERLDSEVHARTTSLWMTVQADAHLYRNLLYIEPAGKEVGGVGGDSVVLMTTCMQAALLQSDGAPPALTLGTPSSK